MALAISSMLSAYIVLVDIVILLIDLVVLPREAAGCLSTL